MIENTNKQTILVPAEGFIGWGGGIDYLRYQLKLLAKISHDNPTVKIVLLLPTLSFYEKIIRLIKDCIKFIIRRPVSKPFINAYELFSADAEIHDNVEIRLYYKNGKNSIQQIVRKYENPLVFPTIKPLSSLQCRQIGYIYDLQHISLSDFFTSEERNRRDFAFKELLSRCDGIIVNSKDVKRHLLEIYPKQAEQAKIFSAPCLPIADEQFFVLNTDISKYNVPEKYFIISNQLWIHKDHKTAFKALQILNQQGHTDIHILCTGQTYDARFPAYYQEIQDYIVELGLEKRICFLGFIPKAEQIAILRKSAGVIQTTLFEGGPGGGSTYEAIAYGVPAVISDIPVNKEIQHPLVSFFQVKNPEDLSQKMMFLLNNPTARPTTEELKIQRHNNITEGAQFLREMFDAIIV